MTAFRALLKKELATLFASPLAYLALTLVMLVTALIFFDHLRIYNQILFLYASSTMGGFESDTIPDHINVRDTVFFPVLETLGITLIALIPVITMRVFAEERARGTDELLLTLQLSPGQIVLAKVTNPKLSDVGNATCPVTGKPVAKNAFLVIGDQIVHLAAQESADQVKGKDAARRILEAS